MTEPTATVPVTYDAEEPVVVRIEGRPLSWKRAEPTATGGRRTNPEQRSRQNLYRAEVDAALRTSGEFSRPASGSPV